MGTGWSVSTEKDFPRLSFGAFTEEGLGDAGLQMLGTKSEVQGLLHAEPWRLFGVDLLQTERVWAVHGSGIVPMGCLVAEDHFCAKL